MTPFKLETENGVVSLKKGYIMKIKLHYTFFLACYLGGLFIWIFYVIFNSYTKNTSQIMQINLVSELLCIILFLAGSMFYAFISKSKKYLFLGIRIFTIAALLVHLSICMKFLVVGRIAHYSQVSIFEYIKFSYNLIPLKTIIESINNLISNNVNRSTIVLNLLTNIFIFMPFGVLYPLLSSKLRTFVKYSITFILTVLLFEMLQIISLKGVFDIDDIIISYLGSLPVFHITIKVYAKLKLSEKNNDNISVSI